MTSNRMQDIGLLLTILGWAFGGVLLGQWIYWPDHSPVALSVGMALIFVPWLLYQVFVLRTRVEKLEATLRSPEEVRR